MTAGRLAVFLDRDNTLIHDPGYISRPDQVQLFDDVPEALARLQRSGYLLVVVTNQSGIARGLITEEQLAAVHDRLSGLLAASGCSLEAIYSCPYLDGPEAKVAAYRRASELRKPEPGMLRLAARELNIDLARSWMIGNSGQDVEAGRRAGCRTILLQRAASSNEADSSAADHTVHTLLEAADIVLGDAEPKSTTSEPGARQEQAPDVKPDPQQTAGVVHVIEEIRDQLDRMTRVSRQEDFSIQRLLGSLLQMLSVVAAAWGLWGMFSDQPDHATARLALAVFFQVASLSCWVTSK